MRNYVADHNDGLEAADFDEYYGYPAETDTDLAGRFYVKIERDPERAARLEKRQNATSWRLSGGSILIGPNCAAGKNSPRLLARVTRAWGDSAWRFVTL